MSHLHLWIMKPYQNSQYTESFIYKLVVSFVAHLSLSAIEQSSVDLDHLALLEQHRVSERYTFVSKELRNRQSFPQNPDLPSFPSTASDYICNVFAWNNKRTFLRPFSLTDFIYFLICYKASTMLHIAAVIFLSVKKQKSQINVWYW